MGWLSEAPGIPGAVNDIDDERFPEWQPFVDAVAVAADEVSPDTGVAWTGGA